MSIEGVKGFHGQYQIPRIPDRLKAFVIDLLVVLNITTIYNKIFILFGFSNDAYSVHSFIAILLMYEVGLTTYTSTIGQNAMKYRVTKFLEPTQKISIIQAIIRTLSKYLLGFGALSAITAEQRALHDLISRSVAIGKENDTTTNSRTPITR